MTAPDVQRGRMGRPGRNHETMRRTLILVLGMHRSGTSAVTGMLSHLGVPLGKRLYEGHQGVNEKGYFENAEIADINDEVLLAAGSSWDDILPLAEGWQRRDEVRRLRCALQRSLERQVAGHAVFGVKDPRLCRLLPWWQEMIAELAMDVRYIIVIRSPHEVAASLRRRDGFSLEKGLLLWIKHMDTVARLPDVAHMLHLEYDEVVKQPAAIADAMSGFLGKATGGVWPVTSSDGGAEPFIDEKLRHHGQASPVPDCGPCDMSPIEREAERLYEFLRSRCVPGENGTRGSGTAASCFPIAPETMITRELMMEHMESVRSRYGSAELGRRRMYRSWAWAYAKPVRGVERILRRVYPWWR